MSARTATIAKIALLLAVDGVILAFFIRDLLASEHLFLFLVIVVGGVIVGAFIAFAIYWLEVAARRHQWICSGSGCRSPLL